jgi:putative hemolysin
MTKKDDIFSLSIDDPYEKLLETVRMNSYSRIPIYEQDTDIIVGILLKKDLLSISRSNKNNEATVFDVRKIIREPYFVPLHKKADSVFRELKAKKLHIAIVVDEFGKLAGLITMEDILRELFGKR